MPRNLEPFIRLVRPPSDWQSAYDQWYFQEFGIVDGWNKELRRADRIIYGDPEVREGLTNLTLEEPPTKPQVPPVFGTAGQSKDRADPKNPEGPRKVPEPTPETLAPPATHSPTYHPQVESVGALR